MSRSSKGRKSKNRPNTNYQPKEKRLKRSELKRKAVDFLGGKCQVCGYNRCLAALTFHHLDPEKKNFGVSEVGNRISWDELKKEISGCAILCSNCHSELHQGLISINKNIKAA
jgi:5-methylcytosine-specific restriction endonuclease McrA